MKKVLCAIICISMLCNMFVLSASANIKKIDTYDKAVAVFKYIGVISNDTSEFDADRSITRAEFADYVAKVLNIDNRETNRRYFIDVPKDYWASGSINALVETGCVVGDNKKFEPDNAITAAQAVTILLTVCGYKFIAEQYGGFPNGYMKAAQENKLLKSIDDIDALSNGEAISLIFEAFTMGTYSISGNADTFVFDKDKTVFSIYQDIYVNRGTLEGGLGESIYGTAVRGNEILIDGIEYDAEGFHSCTDMLGEYVEYVYQENKSMDNSMIFVRKIGTENNTVKISGADIIGFERDTYELKYTQGNSTKKKSISYGAKVIYNGTAASIDLATEIGMLMSGERSGVIYLKSIQRSGVDLVIIESCISLQVGTIKNSNTEFYSENTEEKILLDDYDVVNIYGANGDKLEAQNIKKSDVLSIATSQNKRIVKIYVSDTTVSGKIISVNYDERTVATEKESYELSEKAIDRYRNILSVGNNVCLYFDAFMNIAYVELISNEYWQIGYVIEAKLDKDHNDEDCVRFKILNSNSSVESLYLAKNITVDNTAYSQKHGRNKSDLLALAAMPGISGLTDLENYENDQNRPMLERQIIRYKVNKNGDINNIDTYLVKGSEDRDFTLTKHAKTVPLSNVEFDGVYKLHARQITSGSLYLFGMESLYSTGKSMLFNVPLTDEKGYLYVEDTKSAYAYTTMSGNDMTYVLDERGDKIKAEDSMYYVGEKKFTQGQWYNIDSYNYNAENPYEDIVVYNYGVYQFYTEPIMVSKTTVGLDEDDMIVTKLQGYSEGKSVEFDVAGENNTPNLKAGDIIRGYVNNNNKLTLVEKVFDCETKTFVNKNSDAYYTNTPTPFEGWFSGTVPITNNVLNEKTNSAMYYNTGWQMSFGKIVERNGTVLKWKYPGETEKKIDEVYDFSQLATFIVYDSMQRKKNNTYIGSIDDVDEGKTDIVFTSRSGYAKNVFIYK